MNQSLGIPQIKAYNDSFQYDNRYLRRIFRTFANPVNEHIVNDLDDTLDVMESTGWQYIENAINLQKVYFKNMVSFIKRLELVR